jgi:hypothetical protein
MRTPWTGQAVKVTVQPNTYWEGYRFMRVSLTIILLALSACAGQPFKALRDLTGHGPKPAVHQYPAPPVTPSSVRN